MIKLVIRLDFHPVVGPLIVFGFVICKRYSQNEHMKPVLRLIFRLNLNSKNLLFVLLGLVVFYSLGCSSTSNKNYCDFVVENKQVEDKSVTNKKESEIQNSKEVKTKKKINKL